MRQSVEDALSELVQANHILANEGVLDGFGHVSMRAPDDPSNYFLSRARAPELVECDDLIRFALDSVPVGTPQGDLYSERVIHGAILQDDHGVKPSDMTWVRGGVEQPGRLEKISLKLPSDVTLEDAPATETISNMLDRGEIDGFIAPRPPACAGRNPNVGWLFPDPTAAAEEYYGRTKIFPIMHLVGVRRELVERQPWLCAAVLKAFEQAKARALAKLSDTSATKVTLPFVEEQLAAARELMGQDFWSHGAPANRHVLEAFLRHHHHSQGLSSRLVSVDELFHPATMESFKI